MYYYRHDVTAIISYLLEPLTVPRVLQYVQASDHAEAEEEADDAPDHASDAIGLVLELRRHEDENDSESTGEVQKADDEAFHDELIA